MNAVVISLGGLQAGFLGAYGNGRIDTPHFDRVAAEGFVFDQCFVETPCQMGTRRAWWTARHQFFQTADQKTSQSRDFGPNLVRLLGSNGIRTILLRDSAPPCDELDESSGFDRIIQLEPAIDSPSDRIFATATEWLSREAARGACLLFLDCHGAHPPWNACQTEPVGPADDEETGAARPVNSVSHEVDNLRQLYAATVSQLDRELGEFLNAMRDSGRWADSLVLITSDFAEPLGEHEVGGQKPPGLYEELIHVPLALHLPNASEPASRSRALVQAIDLMPTIFEALGVQSPLHLHGRSLLPIVRLEQSRLRDYACLGIAGCQWATRTNAWHFILPLTTAGEDRLREPELYVKPEDRWERNNVSKQFPAVAEQLESVLRGYAAVAASREFDANSIPRLPPELAGGDL